MEAIHYCLRIHGRAGREAEGGCSGDGGVAVRDGVEGEGCRKVIIDNVFADKYGGSNMSEGARAEEPERSEELMLNPWLSGGAIAHAPGVCCRGERPIRVILATRILNCLWGFTVSAIA